VETAVTGVGVGICDGDGGCASWGGVQDGIVNWDDQVRVVKFGFSSWCAQVGVFKSGSAGRVL
jgi:hypothetical protein